MTITELIKDLIDTSKERLKTPITGAFILSFAFYNWRPIAELFFSKLAIEDRIYIIDQEYCNVWAIVVPLCIAFIYIIGAPMLMVKIDKILIKTKKSRVDNIYESKGHIVDKKIILASKEFQLKNVESGNKEVQDMLDQIESLKETNTQILETNKNTVEQLNLKLKESNEVFKNIVRSEIHPELGSNHSEVMKKFKREELKMIQDYLKEEYIKISMIPSSLSEKLLDLGLIKILENRMFVTKKGIEFKNEINNILNL